MLFLLWGNRMVELFSMNNIIFRVIVKITSFEVVLLTIQYNLIV